MDTHCICLCIL